jgi:thiamine biosynthesis lipoprotein
MIRTAAWRALGTGVRLVTNGGHPEPARRAVEELLALVDATYSRFRPDSELTRLNAQAGQVVPVSGLLLHAVATALRGARASAGLVDPTVGRAMRLIGYDDHFETIAARTHGPVLRFEPVPGWQSVSIDERAQTVRLEPGVELDLGSTGKALAADLAAATANLASGGGGVLVSLGGDIAVAGTAPRGGWRVLAAEDHATPVDAGGEMITLTEGAVATSSVTVRRWTRDGIGLHHLVDPLTGRPAEGPWRTASVAGATCVDANIAATAAILLGERARDWLTQRSLPARLVANDGTIERVAGWPAPESLAVPA